MTDFKVNKNVKWTLCDNDVSHISVMNLLSVLQAYT